MKKTMIATAFALFALAGCRLKDERDFVVEVPALSQAVAQEGRIKAEIASCSGVNMGTFRFEPMHISVEVKHDSDSIKKTVLDALKRAGCGDIASSNIAVFFDQRAQTFTLKAEYGTISGGLSVDGISSFQFDTADPANQCVRLKYDSMKIAKKNIEMAIAQAGYTANGVTPESIGAKPKDKK